MDRLGLALGLGRNERIRGVIKEKLGDFLLLFALSGTLVRSNLPSGGGGFNRLGCKIPGYI